MNSFKVSVIIPVYNTELYIKQTVESIQKQTLYDIEIIIINDGSTDNSLSLLLELSKQDHRIKIFSQENQGLSISRNTGLEKASGEFVYFMDSDDLLEKDALEICYQKCIAEKLDLCFSMQKVSMLKIHVQETTNINAICKYPITFGKGQNC